MLYKGTANRPSFTLLKASPVRPGARKAYLVVETTNEPDDEVAIGTPPVLRVVTYPKTKKGLKMAEKSSFGPSKTACQRNFQKGR